MQIDDFGVEVSNLDGLIVLAVQGGIDLISRRELLTKGDGTPVMGTVTPSTRFAPVSCRA